MKPETRRKTFAAAIPLLLTASLLILGAPSAAQETVDDYLLGRLERNLNLDEAVFVAQVIPINLDVDCQKSPEIHLCQLLLAVNRGLDHAIPEQHHITPTWPMLAYDADCPQITPGFGNTISCFAWVTVDGEFVIDEERTEEVPRRGSSQPIDRILLHLGNVTVVPGQSQPDEGVGGIPTDDHEGTDPMTVHNGTEEVPTDDHEGTDPMTVHNGTEETPVGPFDHDVGTVTVGDEDDNVCVWFTPEVTGQSQELVCVNRGFLVGLDAFVERGDTPIGFHEDPDDAPASGPVTVPGTDPQEVPDAPASGPAVIPGTGPQEVPDVPVLVPAGTAEVPEYTATVDVSYQYDPGHMVDLLTLLGEVTIWSPFDGPFDAEWYATNGDDVPLVVSVTLYEDGDEVDTISVSIPYFGQALAAAEATAGTLP